jgi:hypothetical protein
LRESYDQLLRCLVTFTLSGATAGDRLMAIQKNTAVRETVVRVSGGYHFRVLNECNVGEDIQRFERPGMMTIKLWGVRYSDELRIGFVNDLEDPTSAPFFW